MGLIDVLTIVIFIALVAQSSYHQWQLGQLHHSVVSHHQQGACEA